jgi:hypothetical protein
VANRRRRDPDVAKTDPRCAICHRPTGTAEGACSSTGSQLCYQLGFHRVSDLLVRATVELKGYERKLAEIEAQLPSEEGGHG